MPTDYPTSVSPKMASRHSLLFHFLICLAIVFVLSGCTEKPPAYFQGYVEGEYVLVSSPIAGQLESLAVQRGATVAAGDPLFTLERSFEASALAEAQQGLHRAENRLANLTKGQRPTELDAIRARLEQAAANSTQARLEFARREKLYGDKSISTEELDRARTDVKRNEALVAQLTAELNTAQLGARADEINIAKADIEAARDQLNQARWKHDQKNQAAPQAGLIYDTFYSPGEFVPAAYPVLSLLPPDNIKIRFFVPEPIIGALAPGQPLAISFDGASRNYSAAINYISPQAEYTPPVIYSRETRSKLVFMIEAKISAADAASLHPGQPVDVRLVEPTPQ